MIPWYNGSVGHITEIEQKQTNRARESARKMDHCAKICCVAVVVGG